MLILPYFWESYKCNGYRKFITIYLFMPGSINKVITSVDTPLPLKLNNISWGLIFFLVLVSLINPRPIQAQESPSVSEPILTVSDSEAFTNTDNLVSTSNSNSNIPTSITVNNFEVTGSTVFSPEELQSVVSEYQGRPLSLSELFQVRSAITKLYTESGYVNSGAYIPPQELEDGTVTIAVLEGQLEGINVTGTKRLNPSYIRSRLEVAAEAPVNVESLLEALQLLRLDPLIKNVSAELSAGVAPGTSSLDVEIEEAKAFKVTTNFDNRRSPSVGSNRRGVGLSHANLLGFGDKISLKYNNTEGSNSIDTFYTLPVNAKNGSLRLAFSYSNNDVIEEPFNPLDIESESTYYELGFRQPLILNPNQEFTMGTAFSFQKRQTTLLDTPFPLSPGAEEDGTTKISAIRLFQEYVNRNDKQVLALRSQFSIGLDIFGSTTNDNAPDSRFFAWRGLSQWVRRLDEDFLFLLRGDVQLSASELVPLEQFRLGGFDSVRGYRQDLVLGDNGMSASAEVRVPIFRFRKIDGVVQLAPFFDIGTVWNKNELNVINNDFLAAVGIGINFSVADRINARLDWGIPLVDVDQGDSLQESGIYFSINFGL